MIDQHLQFEQTQRECRTDDFELLTRTRNYRILYCNLGRYQHKIESISELKVNEHTTKDLYSLNVIGAGWKLTQFFIRMKELANVEHMQSKTIQFRLIEVDIHWPIVLAVTRMPWPTSSSNKYGPMMPPSPKSTGSSDSFWVRGLFNICVRIFRQDQNELHLKRWFFFYQNRHFL